VTGYFCEKFAQNRYSPSDFWAQLIPNFISEKGLPKTLWVFIQKNDQSKQFPEGETSTFLVALSMAQISGVTEMFFFHVVKFKQAVK
jgi:hypothetical protein